MDTIKKHLTIFKINRQISLLNAELAHVSNPRPFLVSGHFYEPNPQPARFIRESEKAFLLRESVDRLHARKAELRRK
jgi:hypothetical protein